MYFAYTCILLGLSFSSAYVIETPDEMKGYRKACAKELDLPSNIDSPLEKSGTPHDPKSQCSGRCLLAKFGMFDEEAGCSEENIDMHGTRDALNHYSNLNAHIAACINIEWASGGGEAVCSRCELKLALSALILRLTNNFVIS